MIYHIQAYSKTKYYGQALNDHIQRLPVDSWIVVRDMDTLPLTHDWVDCLYEAIEDHPDTTLFTCATNRVFGKPLSEKSDIRQHIVEAERRSQQKKYNYTSGVVPAFFWMFSHATWREHKFDDHPIIYDKASFDARWTRSMRGIKRVIEHLYIWHTYRLGKNTRNYKHLL